MIFRFLIITLIPLTFLFSQEMISDIQKQKDEVIKLKKELTEFYDLKENEYQTRKKELETLLSNLEKTKKDIEIIKQENIKLLNDVTQKVQSKTSAIYNSMKPKSSAAIFNQMIADGKIDDVLDIIIGLNEKRVTSIFKFMNLENSAELTLMLKNYNDKIKKEEN